MKNNSYFILKALSILRYFSFCPDYFDHEGKRLDKKAKINLKFNGVTYCHNILSHMLPTSQQVKAIRQ